MAFNNTINLADWKYPFVVIEYKGPFDSKDAVLFPHGNVKTPTKLHPSLTQELTATSSPGRTPKKYLMQGMKFLK